MPKWDLVTERLADYAPVADRITLFYRRFPMGRIVTELMSRTEREVVFRASVFRLPEEATPAATGWASEREGDGEVNAVACLENTETSAIGRALANLGFTASTKRPSAEEMRKAARARSALLRELAEKSAPAGSSASPCVVREPDLLDDPVQRLANATLELLRLLDAARRSGASAARVESLRSRLLATGTSARDRERIGRAVRAWLTKRAEDGFGERPSGPA